MSNPAPGFIDHPDHKISITSVDGIVATSVKSEEIVRTNEALVLDESTYPPVFYLPLRSIPQALLSDSDHETWCPFKGTASYFHLIYNGELYENAAWSYRNPFDEAHMIKDHVGFYPNVAAVELAI